MPGRTYSATNAYRYGFNGKENDNEVKQDANGDNVQGGQQDYGMRIYDPRVGRFLSVDPLTKGFPHYTPYSYAGNKPIKFIDLDGLEEVKHWYDYDINDLMNWLSKPDDPLKNDGFIHKSTSAFNRNFNPIFSGYVIATGQDPSSSDYPKMSRTDAAFNLTTQVVLHKSLTIAVKPTAAAQLEIQMTKNAAVMGQPQKTITQAASNSAVNIDTKSIINIVEEDGYAVIRDINNQTVGKGWVAFGELNLSIKTQGSALAGKGSDIFRILYSYVNKNFDAINSIRGTWRPNMPSNLNQFNKMVKEGKSLSEAAFETFTGGNAKALGFKTADILPSSVKDANGVYTSVDVLFKK